MQYNHLVRRSMRNSSDKCDTS